MNIALYEPDLYMAQEVKELILEYFKKPFLPIRVHPFNTGNAFLQAAESVEFQIFIISIEKEGADTGLAQQIRALSQNPVIILSSSDKFALWAYSVNAVHYLLKPVQFEQMKTALSRCAASFKEPVSSLEVKVGHKTLVLPQKEIHYIEVWNKVATIYLEKHAIRTYSSLDALYGRLDHDIFMRPQRSFIVNMYYIADIQHDSIILNNNLEITLSRIERTNLKKQYQDFIFRAARNLYQ